MLDLYYDRFENIVVIDKDKVEQYIFDFLNSNKVVFNENSQNLKKNSKSLDIDFNDFSNMTIGVFFKDKIDTLAIIALLEFYGLNKITVFHNYNNIFSKDIIITDVLCGIMPDNVLIIDIKNNEFILDRLYKICLNFFTEYSEKFYSLLFHKFKNPLSTMYGYIQLLGDKLNNIEKSEKYYKKISEQFNIMNSLIKKTSEFVVIIEKENEKIDLYNMFKVFISSFEKITGKYIEIDISEIKDKNIIFNYEMFEKVLFNIFLNYIDNNEKKKYFFNIKLEEDDFFMLKIIAIDMKIPLNYMHKIFEPFFSTGKGKNFGIGLNEVKKILNMKNCGIHVLNNKNSSEFIIFLPKKLTYQI